MDKVVADGGGDMDLPSGELLPLCAEKGIEDMI